MYSHHYIGLQQLVAKLPYKMGWNNLHTSREAIKGKTLSVRVLPGTKLNPFQKRGHTTD